MLKTGMLWGLFNQNLAEQSSFIYSMTCHFQSTVIVSLWPVLVYLWTVVVNFATNTLSSYKFLNLHNVLIPPRKQLDKGWVCRKAQRMPLNPSAVLFKRDADKCFGIYIIIYSLRPALHYIYLFNIQYVQYSKCVWLNLHLSHLSSFIYDMLNHCN